MNEEPHEESEHQRRTRVNLVAAVAILVLIIGGYWLMNFLEQRRKLENCLEAGRRNCIDIIDPSINAPR